MSEIPVTDEQLSAMMDELETQLGAALAQTAPVAQPPQPAPTVSVTEPVFSGSIEAGNGTFPASEESAQAPEESISTQPAAASTEASADVVEEKLTVAQLESAGNAGMVNGHRLDSETLSATSPIVGTRNRVYRAQVQVRNQLNHYIDVAQFQDDIHIDETNMDQAMMEQSRMRAFYGAQAAYTEAQASREKARFEILESKLYDLHRKELAAKGEKVTENMVDSAVKKDPRWLTGKERVIEAETVASINKGLVSALSDRRDMLIQLGADRREEFKGQVRIVNQQAEKQSMEQRANTIANAIGRTAKRSFEEGGEYLR